ncbi:Uncharacterised protein [Streptococcus pneumoniae]|nr:Uncharacterised protein [Streptococcus pneumoniae]
MVISLICLVVVLPCDFANAVAVTVLLPYLVRKSLESKLAFLSSIAVTVNVTHWPSVTVWLAGVMVKVGACVSGASVGVTASLRADFTSPPLLTMVSAVIGRPGKASVTVTTAV